MKLFTLFFLLLFISNSFAQQTETIYLSGIDAENTVDWEFFCSKGQNSGKWESIAVPSCWEQKGFGIYNYGKDPFEERQNETGQYKYKFQIPASWKDKEITIVFDGVMTDAEVKINGKLAGPIHQGAFYQFKYNISKLLKAGKENQLEVFVKKHSDNETVSLAERFSDYWIFGGIYRPVFLEAKPTTNIQRVAVDAKANGLFKADVYLANPKSASKIEVELKSIDGQSIASFSQEVGSEITRVENKFNDIQAWNPEYPNLYKVIFSLIDKKENVIHQYKERIGFRTIEVRESDGIYVNGVKIKMKGVNRHTFHPKHGRTSSKELSITAVNLMKDMNMNAVRMSHYSPDKHFLDVCDSLGMFVLDELTAWQEPSYDDVVGRKLLEELIADDVNHPCIILWDNGNEGGENNNLNDDFVELDIQKRIVLHPWQDYEMTNTLHYINYNYLSMDGFSKRKIYFPTEFLHGLYDGGHGAGLEDYWFRLWNDPLSAGGFLWVFADESVERTDRNNELDTSGNLAPDGIVGPYNEKEGSYFTIKDIWSPIQFEKRYITSDFNGILGIENRYHYTNLNACLLKAEWLNFSAPNSAKSESIINSEELILSLDPGAKTNLSISLPENWQSSDALRIKAFDRSEKHINTWVWPVKDANKKAKELTSNNSSTKPIISETTLHINIKAGSISLAIKKEDGTISEIKKGEELIPLSNGPVFVSNDKKVESIKHFYDQNNLKIEVKYDNTDLLIWTINGDGTIHLDVSYEPFADSFRQSKHAGITFDFPEESVAAMKWLGNGPYRVYKNRMKGPKFGVWEKAYNNTITGYSGFEYPEFKGYHANVYWAEIKGKNSPDFKVIVHSNDIFLRMLTPVDGLEPRSSVIDYPKGDLSFLHAITPIGTKFKPIEDLGPQSSTYFFQSKKIHGGKLTMKLTFDFN